MKAFKVILSVIITIAIITAIGFICYLIDLTRIGHMVFAILNIAVFVIIIAIMSVVIYNLIFKRGDRDA